MYYELYIDILFMVNFMMDVLLLWIVKQITKCPTTQFRIFTSGAIGALLTCATYLLPINSILIKFLLFHTIINTIMIKVGFKCNHISIFIQCFISLYIGGFILGGVFQYFRQYLKLGSLFFLVAILSYIVVRGIWWFIEGLQLQKSIWYEVEIVVGQESIEVKALLDTGNGLVDPSTGKSVSILEKDYDNDNVSRWLEKDDIRIPFHSIGGEGVLKGFCATCMKIKGKCEYRIEKPIIAVSDVPLSKKQGYSMILSPDIF